MERFGPRDRRFFKSVSIAFTTGAVLFVLAWMLSRLARAETPEGAPDTAPSSVAG